MNGAAVGAAESVATQLIETGTVCLGAVLVDTALGAIPGGTGAKTVAKESIKAGAEIAAKKAAKEAAEKTAKAVIKGSKEDFFSRIEKESGSQMIAKGKKFDKHNQLTKYFNETYGEEKGTQVHHIVEQRKNNLRKFGEKNIHNTGNSVRLSDELHYDITGLYNSYDKEGIFKKITGIKIPEKTKVRDVLDNLSFDEQYEIGIKVLKYFSDKRPNSIFRCI